MQRSIPGSLHFASKATSYTAMLIAALGLAACGGGGGGGSNPPPSGPSTQPPPATNTAPTANAGADQTIKLPANSVELSGSATDAENNTLTYAWTSSPADGVTFDSASAAATRATFTNAGSYTLTLTANDGTTTGTDTVAITVEPADTTPPPTTETAWPGPDAETDPNHGWVAAAASEVGMDETKLLEAENYARTGGGAGMIVRHGKLVRQWSDATSNPQIVIDIDEKIDLKSTTKSMGGIALGIALDDPALQLRLSDTAVTHLPSIGTSPATDPTWPAQITIQQLATHTAGFAKSASNNEVVNGPPGTQWVYSDRGLNWLADVLTTKFNSDLQTVLRTKVWTPLGITGDDLTWTDGPVVNSVMFRRLNSGISANANAMARIGLLFLRKGMWRDQRILSEQFVQTAGTPQEATKAAKIPDADAADFPSANLGYGVLWWTNAEGQLANVPKDAYWAWGLGDSLIVVIPSLDLVITRVGTDPDGNGPHWRYVGAPLASRADWNGDYSILQPFLDPIVQSVTDPSK